ncbi:MAG: PTS sugar transporter subunit IIC, partial [Ruminococcaceae bacterium]|nr:PTS sugar transporter subunit IIC [Oscillospiraceae bacterium]
MKHIKKLANEIFIEGLSGMATGLFATLIIGTIIQQIGGLFPGVVGELLFVIGKVAASVTGVGIGCGVAVRLKESPLVIMSAATCGMVGAFASKILAGSVLVDGNIVYAGPGEPLGAFIASIAGIYMGRLVSGKTKVDIIITPLLSILAGSVVGLLLGPPISKAMVFIGELINMSTQQQPLIMGVLVSVLMGMLLTLPISSAALGIIL